jgi:hypothetical protein
MSLIPPQQMPLIIDKLPASATFDELQNSLGRRMQRFGHKEVTLSGGIMEKTFGLAYIRMWVPLKHQDNTWIEYTEKIKIRDLVSDQTDDKPETLSDLLYTNPGMCCALVDALVEASDTKDNEHFRAKIKM